MLSKRGSELLFLALLTLIVAACCALVLSIAWFGLDSYLPGRTIKATALGWLVGFPVTLLFAGSVRRFTSRLAR
ncbi:MAG: hypothetical protein KF805_00080 [Phycisphaeraceae bacterium]|nr:hypothetical protein [Phycisphaeraceae bacterium]